MGKWTNNNENKNQQIHYNMSTHFTERKLKNGHNTKKGLYTTLTNCKLSPIKKKLLFPQL